MSIIGVIEYKGQPPCINFVINGKITLHKINYKNYIAFYDIITFNKVCELLTLSEINKMRMVCGDFKIHENLPGYNRLDDLVKLFNNVNI